MEIRVNQDAKERNFNAIIESILSQAQEMADYGINQFTYTTPIGVSTWQVSEEVRRQTNNTVYVPSRGVSERQITFCIKD